MKFVFVNPWAEQSAPPTLPTVTLVFAVLPLPPLLLGVTENDAVAVMFTIWLGVAVGVATPGPVHA